MHPSIVRDIKLQSSSKLSVMRGSKFTRFLNFISLENFISICVYIFRILFMKTHYKENVQKYFTFVYKNQINKQFKKNTRGRVR